tara:strand:- start:8332 stop:9300 length:969 start_codon:yes stop_codon:yes gene_type:complete
MKKDFCALFFLIISLSLNAQDNQYSQFYANKIYLNPAFSGASICPRAILGFRDQWPGINGEYVSYTASFDQLINGLGFGILFNGDDAGRGVLKTNNFSGIISPKIGLYRNVMLSFGLEAGIIQKRLDHSSLTFPDQFDQNGLIPDIPRQINSDLSVLKPDFSAGVLLYSPFLYVGYSVHHLMNPDISLLRDSNVELLYRRHTAHLGANIILYEPNPIKRRKQLAPKISPQIIFQQQGPAREINLGVYYTKNNFTSGIYYRNQDALILLFGLQTKKLNFGFSYDVTLSKLKNNTLGAIELSIAYKFNCRKPKKNHVRIDCPSF